MSGTEGNSFRRLPGRYVEGRFGIRAPEQTTKEFLQAARHHPSIREDHQRMLAAFLRAADMVKFAAQRPGPAECDRGIDAVLVDEGGPVDERVDHLRLGHDRDVATLQQFMGEWSADDACAETAQPADTAQTQPEAGDLPPCDADSVSGST